MNKWKDGNWEKVETCLPGASFGLTGNGSEEGAGRRSWVAHGLMLEAGLGGGPVTVD